MTITIKELLHHLDEILGNPNTVGPQGGEDRDALVERIEKNNFQSEDLKKLSVEIIDRLFELRMKLGVENAHLKARLAKL
ncbi:MAG TPA: hypothetical protein VJ571_02710 [Candidatus Nitrosotalea sp.]|nr:hypothetical protein [Candidatus Nitrosotalea sp.]